MIQTATAMIDRCPLCDTPLPPNAKECTRCDWTRGADDRKHAGNIEARDLVAACLSIIPGMGHLYKGHTLAGWMFLGGTLIVFLFAFAFFMFLGPLLIPAYWMWVIFQAYWIEDLKIPGGKIQS